MTGLEAYEIVKEECRYAFGQTANGDRVRESLPIIEKELKAFEIIKRYSNRMLFQEWSDGSKTLSIEVFEKLSEEEFDLLKEVLEK